MSGGSARWLAAVGDPVIRGLAYVGGAVLLGARSARQAALIPLRGRRPRLAATGHQGMMIAIRALPVLSTITFFLGLILAMQAAHTLEDFGAMRLIASSVAISMTREIGPLMTAIVVLGRSGSAFATEIATMKVNQELDALYTMGLDPVRLLVGPKLLAMLLVMPCLVVWSNLLGVLGGSVFGVTNAGFTLGGYLETSVDALFARDIATGLVKSAMFGLVIVCVGCYEGFTSGIRPEDVGRSATAAVVNSTLMVIVVDLVFTTVFYLTGK